MIGADEHTLCDKHGNIVTVRRTLEGHDKIKAALIAQSFEINGDTINSARRDVVPVLAKIVEAPQ